MAKDDKPIEEVKEIPEPEEKESPEPEAPEEAEVVEEETPEELEPEVETPEEEKPPSRREQLRVQQLLERYGPPPKRPEQSTGLDYSQLDAEPEVIKQLEDDRRAVSDEAYQQGISRVETIGWRNTLKLEAPLVEEKFTFLNPRDKENFHPAAADAMNAKYLRFIGYNPGDPEKGIPESVMSNPPSYRDFVESEMEFVDELATQKVANTTKNIARQAATTGLRPDGGTAKRMNFNQSPQQMDDETLKAYVEQAIPKT